MNHHMFYQTLMLLVGLVGVVMITRNVITDLQDVDPTTRALLIVLAIILLVLYASAFFFIVKQGTHYAIPS